MDAALNSASTDRELLNFYRTSRFLAQEAKLLDERRFEEWFALLDDEITYELPIRQTKLDFKAETAAGGYSISDTKTQLRVRVDRLASGVGWSEIPPSRTLRVVGSVIVNPTDRDDVLEVDSAQIIYRQRRTVEAGDIVPVRRLDLIRISDGTMRLLRRRILLTEISSRTPNLGIFF
jgi:N,N-dimethyl phenylurea N-demethylase beta subunit